MKKVTAILIALSAIYFLAKPVLARTFYLKNGEEINYQKSWKKNGRIYVLINRDTLIDFAPEEVNLKKTYHHGVSKKRVKHHYGKRHKGVLNGHGKGMKPSDARKTPSRKTAPESPAAGKAMPIQPAMKAHAGAQKRTAGQAPKAPAKNAPVGR
jgi:hypothetical protein